MKNGSSEKHVISASAIIPARRELVYSIIANYKDGHRRIIPKQFSDITVEQGGIGAGTVIRFQMSLLGKTRTLRAQVTEPEPGRVLAETYLDGNDTVTTFTVDPGSAPADSRVTISTEMPAASGVRGMIERTVTGMLLRPIYAKELENLARVATGPFAS